MARNRGNGSFKIIVLVSTSLAGASPALANPSAMEEARTAIAKAMAARNEADRALAAAQAALAEAERPGTSIAAKIPPLDQSDSAAEALPAYCDVGSSIPTQIVRRPNAFQAECLDLRRWKDFQVADLNVQLAGNSDSSMVEITPSYTWRWGPPEDPDQPTIGYPTSYLRLKGGLRASLDPGSKSASFADLSTFDLMSGVAGVFGIEYGRARSRPVAEYAADVGRALQKARQDCVDHYSRTPLRDPVMDAEATTLVYRDETSIRALCHGKNLSAWMSDPGHASTYYQSLIHPVWGYNAVPRIFGGVEVSYSKPEYKFFPISDPAKTGHSLITALPADFPGGASKIRESVYSIKGYAGTGISRWADISFSLTYRKDFAFPKDTQDQQLCTGAGAPFDLCHKRNIAPPYQMKGFVAGGRLAFELPRLGFIPNIAVELRPSYALDIRRWGIEAPIYFVPDSKGKPHGGVLLGCTSAGETRTGYPLEKDCRASLFVGTEFRLAGERK
jgi:hypothetical protein